MDFMGGEIVGESSIESESFNMNSHKLPDKL